MGNVAPRVVCKAFELAKNGSHAEALKYAGVISNAEVALGRGAVVGTKVRVSDLASDRALCQHRADLWQYATVLANSYPQSASACRKPLLAVTESNKSNVEARCEEIILLEKHLTKEGYTGKGLRK
jgi:uncharacterized protein (DUF433 family)